MPESDTTKPVSSEKRFALIAMGTYRVVNRFETAEEADAAKEQFDGASNVMEIGGEWSGFTGVDLVAVYNTAIGDEKKRIKRFSTREDAVRRVNALLLSGVEIAAPPEEEQKETPVPAKKKSASAPAKKRKEDAAVKITLTAAGRKDDLRFNEGSARSKVHAAIKRANSGGIELSELVRNCSSFAKRGQVLGCVDKLKAKGYVKVE